MNNDIHTNNINQESKSIHSRQSSDTNNMSYHYALMSAKGHNENFNYGKKHEDSDLSKNNERQMVSMIN